MRALTYGLILGLLPVGLAQVLTAEEITPSQLAYSSGCLECHSVEEDLTGPAYRNVAARYEGDPDARARLVATVKGGGKGNWTSISRGVPMPPHSGRLEDAEVERLVDWVLGLVDKPPEDVDSNEEGTR